MNKQTTLNSLSIGAIGSGITMIAASQNNEKWYIPLLIGLILVAVGVGISHYKYQTRTKRKKK